VQPEKYAEINSFYHMQRKLYIIFFKSNMIFMEMTCLLRQNEGIDRPDACECSVDGRKRCAAFTCGLHEKSLCSDLHGDTRGLDIGYDIRSHVKSLILPVWIALCAISALVFAKSGKH